MTVEPIVTISAIEHFVYCPRQCALIHDRHRDSVIVYRFSGPIEEARLHFGRSQGHELGQPWIL